jgi:hypothetical protein
VSGATPYSKYEPCKCGRVFTTASEASLAFMVASGECQACQRTDLDRFAINLHRIYRNRVFAIQPSELEQWKQFDRPQGAGKPEVM